MKVLIVKTSSMGDLIHTIYAIEDLYNFNKKINIHWICEKDFYELAKLHKFVNKIYTIEIRKYKKNPFSRSNLINIYKIRKKIKEEKYDLVIDNQGLIKSLIISKFASTKIYGFDKKIIKEKIVSYFYDKTFILKNIDNVISKNRELFSKIFHYNINFDEVRLKKDNLNFEKNYKRKNNSNYNLFIHTSSKNDKLWPIENWRNLAKLINKYDKNDILLTYYSEEEYKRSIEISKGYDFIKIVPKKNLKELITIINNSDSVIGLDSGLFHLSNLLNKPTVGIYNKTIAYYTKVIGRNWQLNLGGNYKIPDTEEVFKTWIEVKNNYDLYLKENKK